VAAAADDAVASVRDLKVARIDVFGARGESEFYAHLAAGVLRATGSRWQEWTDTAREFLSARRSPRPHSSHRFSLVPVNIHRHE
jgi:hypothetical protein